MDKIDFKKSLKHLYAAPAGKFVLVEVPRMQFLMVDGFGDPNTAPDYEKGIGWLFSVGYALKFISKAVMRDYVVPPMECLWWSDDPDAFVKARKDDWHWTLLLMTPQWISESMYEDAVAATSEKLGSPPPSLRMESFEEGLSVQVLHKGTYSAEGPVIARLHDEYLPEHGLAVNGRHHEIYLSDPRKTAPERLRTIIRQPVRRHTASASASQTLPKVRNYR